MTQLLLSALTGHGVMLPLGVFLLAGALVFRVAGRLAHHADVIADTTGLGRLWIGSLLLAGSTSLPEIITDVNAAAFDVPNIGVGDLFGSTLANMLILSVLMIVYERRQLLRQAALDHALLGTLGILLTALAGLSIAGGGLGVVFGLSLDTLAILLIYLTGMRVVFDMTRPPASTPPTEAVADAPPARNQLRSTAYGFATATLGLLVITPILILSTEALAIEAGISDTFVGTFLVGLTTSCPELAAAIAAARIGAVDLAVGNIFGSNAFNMTVLFLMDLANGADPLLATVSRSHVLSAAAAVAALALGVMRC